MTRADTCTREMIEHEMARHGESWADVVASTLGEAEGLERFTVAYGGVKSIPFTVWTARRVYFPGCYDGMEWCESVARHPDGKPTDHVGGG